MSSLNTHDPNVSSGTAQALDRLLTLHEVATRLGVCYETARQLVNRGEMTCIRRPGCQIRVPASSLSEYLERYTCPARKNRPASSSSKTVKTGISGIGVKQRLRAGQIARRLSNA
ncbi:MAG: hypothetical protein CMO05_08565 [Thalassospira sp.]|nr:hypothetical protein [Thalassospira sp.]